MPTKMTAAELKHLIQIRMNALADVEADGERLIAHDVEWHAPDESGRNWDMDGYLGPADYATEVRVLVNSMRREYWLADERARYWISP
jgi:hypothetical protein